MGDAIKYLYSQFILRDVLSFITPGAIVVLTAFLLYIPEPKLDTFFAYSASMHWLLYIPLFGVFYLVGFAVQCFGEIFDIIRFTPRDQGTWCQRFGIFWINWAREDNIWWKDAHRKVVAFNEYTETDKKKWARQQHERLVVLKQMCANGCLATVIAATIITIHYFCQYEWHWLLLFWTVMLLASLFWGYRVHVLRQDTINRAVQHELQDANKES